VNAKIIGKFPELLKLTSVLAEDLDAKVFSTLQKNLKNLASLSNISKFR
jgi:hypothetical protein